MDTASKLVALLSARKLTCCTAESCTGGGVAGAITAVPGASEVFDGAVVSYSNAVKTSVLKVGDETLKRHGAVSEECASEMAAGARALMKSDLAVSVTGIAGPGGGSAEKPVGLVCFAIATKSGVRTEKAIFKGDREGIRAEAVLHALGMLCVGAL